MAAKVVNDLLDYNLKIVQDSHFFKFSLDSVLLAEFIKIDLKDKKLLDLCTGNTPLPLVISSRIKEVFAVELQQSIYNLAKESIEINNIKNIILINDNIKNLKNYFPGNNFDIITCNPPYFKYNNSTVLNETKEKAIARHELEITLKEIIKIAAEFLRDKGKFCLVHRANRLAEIINELENNNFGIKKIQPVYHTHNSDCSMLLIEAKKNAKSEIKILKPLITENYRR